MQNIFQKLSISKNEIANFCLAENIDLMVIFGSHASGRIHKDSDLDVAIRLSDNKNSPDTLELIQKLTQLFDDKYFIDLTLLTPLTGYVLANEIFSGGIPIYEKRSGLFESESLRAWSLYQDSKALFSKHHQIFMENFFKRWKNVS